MVDPVTLGSGAQKLCPRYQGDLEVIGDIDSRAPEETRGVDGNPNQRGMVMTCGAEQVEHLKHAQLWELGITELAGHNIEAQGREEVNKMLKEGWMLLHIYTLHYSDDGVWRQRPMAILGRSTRQNM